MRAGAFASANFGTAPQLRAKKGISPDNTRRSYVKFAVTEVQAGDHITLRLTGYLSNTTNPTLRTLLYAVSDTSWNEHIMTWYTRPNLDAMLASVVVSGTARQKFDIDVTRYVQQQKTAGHDVVSFALRNPTHSSAQAIFDSREAGLGGPRLIITQVNSEHRERYGDAVKAVVYAARCSSVTVDGGFQGHPTLIARGCHSEWRASVR